MREDYIAELTPYADLLSDRLQSRFRLESLSPQSALAAIKNPAEQAGRIFDDGVAEKLVDKLRGGIKNAERKTKNEKLFSLSETVEAVHLQVVCRQLWEELPPEQTVIKQTDELKYGDVDKALTQFYETALKRVLTKISLSERQLRAWFNEQLITPNQTRSLVYREVEKTAGLPNEAVDILEGTWLIRMNKRGLDSWYELAHDRLVAPIFAANELWTKTYQNILATATLVWLKSGHNPKKLLKGDNLKEAQRYIKTNPNDVTKDEHLFLEESMRAEKRRNYVWITATFTGLILIVITILAVFYYFEAKQNAQFSKSRELAARAITNLTIDPELSILLALKGLDTKETDEATFALRQALLHSRVRKRFAHADETVQFRDMATLSKDGNQVAVATHNGQIEIWNLEDMIGTKPERVLDGHKRIVVALDSNIKKGLLVSAGQDKTVRLWDIDSGNTIFTTSYTTTLLDVAFSSDGSRLAIVGVDQLIEIWDVPSKQKLSVLTDGHTKDKILSVAFSPTGERLATGGEDRQIVIWNIADDKWSTDAILRGHDDEIYRVAFHPTDETRLASASRDKTAILWKTNSDDLSVSPTYRLDDHSNSIIDVEFSPNGQCIATASLDGTSRLWDSETGENLTTLYGHQETVRAVAFIPNQASISGEIPTERCGRDIITASEDGTIRWWNIGANGEGRIFVGHTDVVEDVVSHPEGTQLATASSDNTAKIWNAETGEMLHNLDHEGRVSRITYSSDGRYLATASDTAKLWDTTTGERLQSYETHKSKVHGLSFVQGGKFLATVHADSSLVFWDTFSGTKVTTQTFHGHKGIFDVAISPDDSDIIIGTQDGKALIYSSSTFITSLAHTDSVYDVALSADGRYLATAGWDKEIQIWSTSNWQRKHRFTEHRDRVLGVDFSHNNQMLASASADKQVIIWNVNSGAALHVIQALKEELNGVAFTDNDKEIAVASDDGTVRLYWLDINELKNVARSRLTREWTKEECEDYLPQMSCTVTP